jgi:hypothetical protein
MKLLRLLLLFALILSFSGCGCRGYWQQNDPYWCLSEWGFALGLGVPKNVKCSEVIQDTYEDYLKCKESGDQQWRTDTQKVEPYFPYSYFRVSKFKIYQAWEKCEAECPDQNAIVDCCAKRMKEEGYVIGACY